MTYEVVGSGAHGEAVVVVGDVLADVTLVASGTGTAAGALLVTAKVPRAGALRVLLLPRRRRHVARKTPILTVPRANCIFFQK